MSAAGFFPVQCIHGHEFAKFKEIMQGFKQVMTIESNWSDRPEDQIIDESNRRYSSLAILLRARYLVDVDCWSEVKGQPIKPGTIRRVIMKKLNK